MGIKISELSEAKNAKNNDLIPIVDVESKGTKKITKENFLIDVLKIIYPIGATYITQTNDNPSQILGFGTWERLKGKVCLGLDEEDTNLNVIGKTGGEKEHALTIEEMPSHTHGWGYANSAASGNSTWGSAGGNATGIANDIIKNTGGGKAHNNMQPYEVVGYMWIRRD